MTGRTLFALAAAAAGAFLFMAKWNDIAGAVDVRRSPLYVQERDIFYVDYDRRGLLSVEYEQLVGVGAHSRARERARFDITLRDALGEGERLTEPPGREVTADTIYGTEIAVPFRGESSPGRRSLVFDLRGAPAVDLSAPGSCCGCEDFACGGGCSAEFTYRTDGGEDLARWFDFAFDVERSGTGPDGSRLFTIRAVLENRGLGEAAASLHFPLKADNRATGIQLLSWPEGFEREDSAKVIELSGFFEGEEVLEFIIAIPVESETLVLEDFLVIEGKAAGLLRPPVEPVTERRVERLEETLFVISCLLELTGGMDPSHPAERSY